MKIDSRTLVGRIRPAKLMRAPVRRELAGKQGGNGAPARLSGVVLQRLRESLTLDRTGFGTTVSGCPTTPFAGNTRVQVRQSVAFEMRGTAEFEKHLYVIAGEVIARNTFQSSDKLNSLT